MMLALHRVLGLRQPPARSKPARLAARPESGPGRPHRPAATQGRPSAERPIDSLSDGGYVLVLGTGRASRLWRSDGELVGARYRSNPSDLRLSTGPLVQ